jgi:hypothetical protein
MYTPEFWEYCSQKIKTELDLFVWEDSLLQKITNWAICLLLNGVFIGFILWAIFFAKR